jgi:hypothetical protein
MGRLPGVKRTTGVDRPQAGRYNIYEIALASGEQGCEPGFGAGILLSSRDDGDLQFLLTRRQRRNDLLEARIAA